MNCTYDNLRREMKCIKSLQENGLQNLRTKRTTTKTVNADKWSREYWVSRNKIKQFYLIHFHAIKSSDHLFWATVLFYVFSLYLVHSHCIENEPKKKKKKKEAEERQDLCVEKTKRRFVSVIVGLFCFCSFNILFIKLSYLACKRFVNDSWQSICLISKFQF